MAGRRTPATRAFDDAEFAEPLTTLIKKVARRAYMITDEDIAAARGSGLVEDCQYDIDDQGRANLRKAFHPRHELRF
jgi:hypothetical protein